MSDNKTERNMTCCERKTLRPEETRKKLSESHKGHRPSAETRARMSEAHKKGVVE